MLQVNSNPERSVGMLTTRIMFPVVMHSANKTSTFRSCSWISLQPKVEGLVLFQFWVEILKKFDTQALLAVVSKTAPIWCRDAYVYIYIHKVTIRTIYSPPTKRAICFYRHNTMCGADHLFAAILLLVTQAFVLRRALFVEKDTSSHQLFFMSSKCSN